MEVMEGEEVTLAVGVTEGVTDEVGVVLGVGDREGMLTHGVGSGREVSEALGRPHDLYRTWASMYSGMSAILTGATNQAGSHATDPSEREAHKKAPLWNDIERAVLPARKPGEDTVPFVNSHATVMLDIRTQTCPALLTATSLWFVPTRLAGTDPVEPHHREPLARCKPQHMEPRRPHDALWKAETTGRVKLTGKPKQASSRVLLSAQRVWCVPVTTMAEKGPGIKSVPNVPVFPNR